MRLERSLEHGRIIDGLHAKRIGDTIMTAPLFAEVVETAGRKDDMALSFVSALLDGLVDAASEKAQSSGISTIGLTGGVSYNYTITNLVKEKVEAHGLVFACHDRIPNGDGGVSSGQCAIALNGIK